MLLCWGVASETNCRIVHVPVGFALLSFLLFVNLTEVPDVRKCVMCGLYLCVLW